MIYGPLSEGIINFTNAGVVIWFFHHRPKSGRGNKRIYGQSI
jgi:hypothetical protein